MTQMSFFKVFLSLLAGLLMLGCCPISAEFYSSIHEMSKVFNYEQKMLQHIDKFIADNESKLQFLKARLAEFEQDRDEAENWGTTYLDSPLNKYLMTKRLTVDWTRIDNLMATQTGAKPLMKLQKLRSRHKIPDVQELEGALDGLLRLQYIYRLSAKDLAAGILNGVDYGTKLEAQHCVDIARLALRDDHPRLAHAWLLAAQERFLSSGEESEELQAQVLALLVQAKAVLGDFRGLNVTYEELLQLQPANEEHAKNYEQFMLTHVNNLTHTHPTPDSMEEHAPVPGDFNNLSEFDMYRFTCSGHIRPTPKELRPLQCGYMTETHPFLLLAPLKVEELNQDPLLVIYHDAIYQNEIDIIKNLTNDRIVRATVTGQDKATISNVRTSQFTFISRDEHKVLRTIDQRVADMTGLNMDFAEDHQFANYGVGGHYAQHMDWFYPFAFESNQVSSQEMGNRIATVLFYLSDVAQGGGTAFPILKQLLLPKKGAAAFWFNLHASGVGDIRTMHGACPIIAGSKWVQNRWIREFVQSDKRPCELWDDSVISLSQMLDLAQNHSQSQ